MADRYGSARSNYFQVKDVEAFRQAMARINLEVVGRKDDSSIGDDGPVAVFSTHDEKGGWPCAGWNEETNEDFEVDVEDEIARHLADGEVAVLMECGAEKLRYLTGTAVAVNNTGETRRISLDDVYPLAHQLGPGVTDARC